VVALVKVAVADAVKIKNKKGSPGWKSTWRFFAHIILYIFTL